MTSARATLSPAGSPRFTWHGWLGLAILAVVYAGLAAWHVRYGATNTDEGFYAVTTRAVTQGEVPYRDFGFTQPPLVLYANALPMKVAGFGLVPQRVVNGLWAAGALALGIICCARRAGPGWSLGLAALFSLSAPWMYFMHWGKTYGLTALLVMAATWVFLGWETGPRRLAALGLLVVLGCGTRLTAAPFFGILWLLALWPRRRPSWREVVAAIGSVAIAAAVLLLPFWWMAPEQARFWVFDFHWVSVPARSWKLGWRDIASLGPGVWVLTGLALASVVAKGRWKTREAAILAAALVSLAFNLLPKGAYDEYGTPFLLPAALAALLLWRMAAADWPRWLMPVAASAVAMVQVGLTPLLTAKDRPDRWSRWLTPKSSPYDYDLPAQLAAARAEVEKAGKPGTLFIGPHLLLAAEAGCAVPRELYMGAFAFTAEMTPDRAARLHLATRAQLDAWFADPQVTVMGLFPRMALNYGWSMPSYTPMPEDAHVRWFGPVWQRFAIKHNSSNFVVMVRRY